MQQRGRAVRDIAIGQADAKQLNRQAVVGQVLEHAGAESAGQHALFERDEQLVLGGELVDQLSVERLREARVGDGR